MDESNFYEFSGEFIQSVNKLQFDYLQNSTKPATSTKGINNYNECSECYDLSGEFNTLDLLNECRKKEEFTDVQLKVGDKLFPAHRVVLSLYSPVLKAAISDQWSSTNICSISDEYVDVEIVEDLLSFLYTGKIKLTSDNTLPVCVAAHYLQISILLNLSVKYLGRLITPESSNVFELFEFSVNGDLQALRESCLRCFEDNYDEVFLNPRMMQLSYKHFKALLGGLSEGFKLRENTFLCIVRWVEENLSERSNYLQILMESISYGEILKKSSSCFLALHEFYIKLKSAEISLPSLEQRLIVIGGRKRENGNFLSKVSSQMNLYNSYTKTWKALPDMSHPRANFCAAVINKRDIVICGGCLTESYQPTDSVEMFSWAKQAWETLSSLPFPLSNGSMVEHNGHLYLIGGPNDSEAVNYGKALLSYSFETKSWRYLANMNHPHPQGKLIKFKEHFYAFGGSLNSPVERYDPVENSWTVVNNYSNSTAATLHNDKIYVFERNFFRVYDPETNLWTPRFVLNFKTQPCTSFLSMNNELLAVGCTRELKYLSQDLSDTISKLHFALENSKWIGIGEIESNLVFHCSVVGHFE